MKRIKLYAYWAQNLGDDLMVHILLKRYPQYQFVSDDWDENNLFLNYSNFISLGGIQKRFGRLNHLINILTFYKKKDILVNAVKKYYNCCVSSVYIGGSLFQQGNLLRFDKWTENEERKLRCSPLYIIGANFGPYHSETFKNAFAVYFHKCGGITFRDRESYVLFADNEKVAYAPDVVFNLDVPDTTENDQSVLISVIDVSSREKICKWGELYDMRMADVCKCCIAQSKTPILMSFCKSEGDEIAIQRIMNKLSEEERDKTEVFRYNGNLEEALELYRKADRVIATRFHAMILALKHGKPVYSISYNPKVKNVLSDMHLDAFCEMDGLEEISAQSILNTCRTIDVSAYTKEAEKQFAQFESFMRDVN